MDRRARALAALLAAVAAVPASAQGDLFTFVGAPQASHGVSVGWAGDVDLDGTPDCVVGAMHDSTGGAFAGGVYVYSGADGQVLHAIFGPNPYEWLGVSVAAAGDVDQDGHPDVVAGASGAQTYQGAAYVFSGKDAGAIHAFSNPGTGLYFGIEVAGPGDLEGDGIPDLVIGKPSGGGASTVAYVFSGQTGSLIATFAGGAAWASAGPALDGLPDQNGDGFPEILVGLHGKDSAAGLSVGEVRAVGGNTFQLLWTACGASDQEGLGWSAAAAGDVDGDGKGDAVAGAPFFTARGPVYESGRVGILSGSTGGGWTGIEGAGMNAHLGTSVSRFGDLDGDGVEDVIAGAPRDTTVSGLAGAVVVISGATGQELGRVPGEAYHADFGQTVAGGFDVDQDGVSDLIAGAPQGAMNGLGSGHARVVSGACLNVRSYGVASPGTGGVAPKLLASGGLPAIGNGSFQLDLLDAVGQSSGALVLGAAPASLSVAWGTFLLDPALPILVVPVQFGGPAGAAGAGSLSLLAPIPNQAGLSGFTVYLQLVVLDPGSSGGLAASGGLQVGICG